MNYRKLRVIISGGGTGGHIFPAVSIAKELKAVNPETEILFVGAEGKMEMEKVPAEGFRIVGLPIAGLQRQLTLHNIVGDLMVPAKYISSVCSGRRYKSTSRRSSRSRTDLQVLPTRCSAPECRRFAWHTREWNVSSPQTNL